MHIVGVDRSHGAYGEDATVHTIDVWYSQRRRAWIVDRLDGSGHHVGASHACETSADAVDCVAQWLRSHPETCLVSPIAEPVVLRAVRRARVASPRRLAS